MKFKKKLLATLILTGQIYPASAALIRDDIDIQVYRDFGENRGVFKPGAMNIPIYNIDGSFSGTVNVMPDFSSSIDGGFATLVDPQVTATATHVNYNSEASFAKRYQQLDATLFSGAEKASSYELMNEVTKRAYEVATPGDYSTYGGDNKITRERTIVTDAAPAELFTDTSQFKTGLLVARTGSGSFYIATAPGKDKYVCYPSGLSASGMCQAAGGMNVISSVDFYQTVPGGVYSLATILKEDPNTAIDVGTLSGDSGSGLWGWDTVSGSWKFIGVDSTGSGTGYNKKSNFVSAPVWTEDVINSFNDPAINTLHSSDIIYIGVQDSKTGEGDLVLNGKTLRYHGIRTDIAESALVDNDFKSNKNLILGGAGGTLELTAQNLNMGAGSLTFNADYLLSDGGDSRRRMNTAGYIINAGATVTSNLTGSVGDIWRKIGAGTLAIAGNGDNHSSLYVGDGLTILQRAGGHAADAIHISSGRAVVRLGAAGQLDGTQVGFGTRGGVLDLYGQSLSWADIIHMDNGATIANSHGGTLSDFTFTGSGPKTYLGNFFDGGSLDKGLLHLRYAPGTPGSSWTLKGNVNARGGMDILHGNLVVQGAYMLHAGGYIDPTQYEAASFDLGDSLVNLTDSQFTVGRNTMARGHFVLDDASSLVVTSGGEVSSSEQGVLEGAYLDGRVELSGAHSVLNVTPEEAFRVQINAALSGKGHIVKDGLGTLYLTGVNTLTGNNLISAGRVIADTLASLGTQSSGWTVDEGGVLDVGDNAKSLSTVLDKISTASRGTLALDGAITSADQMALLRKDLYLGSGTQLDLGVAGQKLTKGVQDLYLGGGGGVVNIKGGLTSGSSLYMGNWENSGTVHIGSSNASWEGNVDIKSGMRLIADTESALGNGNVMLNYGAVADSKIFKNLTYRSAGMVNVSDPDAFGYDMSRFLFLSIGALAGETLTLNQMLKPTETGYYFSGAGDVVVNTSLAQGQYLSLDAQDQQGGTVTLNSENDLGKVVVIRGYSVEIPWSRKSTMTLKYGVDNAIDKNSIFLLYDGSVIDLNGHRAELDIEESTANSEITSSSQTADSTITLRGDTNRTLRSLISGVNMHLIKSGLGDLTLTGSNTFTGDVLLSAGKTLTGNLNAFGAAANIVTVAKNAVLELNGNSIVNSINLASGTLINSTAGALKLGTLSLSGDSTATFNGTTDATTVGKYELNNHRLTVNNVKTTFGVNSLSDGDIVFNNSTINWSANNHSLLSGSGSLTVGQGTTLELRDVIQTEDPAKTLVLDGGTIASGSVNHNGGGAGATLRSALRVDSSGTLNGNNWGHHINLGLYGAISGKGTLNITGGQGVSLFGDTSAFTGNLIAKKGSYLYLSPLADTTLAANLSGEGTGKVYKTGDKNLTLTGDNHLYTNELAMQGGTLTLGSSTAATGGDILMTAGTLKFNSDNKVSFSNLAAGSVVDLHGHRGTLNIKKNAVGSVITSSDTGNWSALDLLVNANSTLNSTITGKKIHLNKQGTGTLTLAASNTFTGDVLLSAGKILTGNLNAFGAAANIVTVAKNAVLELNGNSIANSINLASGTLMNSTAGALKLGTLSLSGDSTATFNGTTDATTVGQYELNNHRLTVNNVKTTFGVNSLSDGDIAFTDSKINWSANNHSLLSGSGSLTVGQGTTLELRDVIQTEGPAKTLVLDGGTIASGSVNHNGGGAGATLRSALQVDTSGTLYGNNWYFDINLGLYGAISGKGTLNISGGQGVSLFGDTSAFTGNLIAKKGSYLYLSPLADTTLAANLSGEGTGKVYKTGDKSLTFTGDNHLYTNEMNVQGGTLTLGSIAAATGGDMRIQSGATLNSEYTNTVGGSLYNSGTVNLKRAGSSLNVKGNYSQLGNSVLGIAIDPLLGAARLNVTGTATLAGTLNTIYAPGTYKAQTYTVLSAQKGVNGTFATITQQGGAGIGQQIGYTANNVTLTTSAAAAVRSLRAGAAVDASAPEDVAAEEPQVLADAEAMSDTVIQPLADPEELALAALAERANASAETPDPRADALAYALADAEPELFSDPVSDPQETFVITPENLGAYDVQRLSIGMQKPTQWSMQQVDWSGSADSKAACDASGNCYHDDAMWIMPHMSNGRLSEGNAQVDGISIGGYTEAGDTRFGVSVDYSDFDLSDSGSSASENRYAFNLFASQKLESVVLTGSLGYTHTPTDVTRQVTSGGYNLGEGNSSVTGNAVSAGLSLNLPVTMGNTQIVPQIGLDSLNVFYSGFDEGMSAKGEEFGRIINTMKVYGDSNRYDSLQPNIGVKISHGLTLGNTEVTPALRVTYRHELMDNNNGNVSGNDGTQFTVQSDNLGRDIVEYEAGVEVKFTPRLSSSVSYTGSNQQGYQSQEGMLRVKYNF